MSSEFQWIFKDLERKRESVLSKLLLKDKNKVFIKPMLLVATLILGIYIFFITGPTPENIILFLIFMYGAPFLIDLKKQFQINEMRYLDLKNSLQIIANTMVYAKEAWYYGGRWSSNQIKDELKVRENEDYQTSKDRDLSEIEKHLWMLYIKTNNFAFCHILTHLLKGEKARFAFINLKNSSIIIMSALYGEKENESLYDTHLSVEPIFLEEPHIPVDEDDLSHQGTIKEYSINDNKWLYWGGLVNNTRNALDYDLAEKLIDKEEREQDPMGHSLCKPQNLIFEVYNGHVYELEHETDRLRKEINNFLKYNY